MRKIRKSPVLFVTAYPKAFTNDSPDMNEMWQDQFADGDTDIIYKPFDFDTLVEKVEGLIGAPTDDEGSE